MTDRLREIELRLIAATPGQWYWSTGYLPEFRPIEEGTISCLRTHEKMILEGWAERVEDRRLINRATEDIEWLIKRVRSLEDLIRIQVGELHTEWHDARIKEIKARSSKEHQDRCPSCGRTPSE